MGKRVEAFSIAVTGLTDAEVASLQEEGGSPADPTKVSVQVSAYNGPIDGFTGTNRVQFSMASTAAAGDDAAHKAAYDHTNDLLISLAVATNPPD